MPPTTIPFPDVDEDLSEFFNDLIDRFEQGNEIFEELRALVDGIIADFGN